MHGYGFLRGGNDSGVKLCVLVRLLSAMSFSHFGELWLARSHGAALLPGCMRSLTGCRWRLAHGSVLNILDPLLVSQTAAKGVDTIVCRIEIRKMPEC